MKIIRNFVIALCASATLWGIFSCNKETEIQVKEQTTFVTKTSIWYFENGTSEIGMKVGDSIALPNTGTGENSSSWVSNDTTVAVIVKEELDQKLEAVGVGKATVTDKNSNMKIYVTVKENN